MTKYFYTDGQKKFGPFSKEELKNENITRKTKIWSYGMDNWSEISTIPELDDVFKTIPPELKIESSEASSINISDTEPKQKKESNKVSKTTLTKLDKPTSKRWIVILAILIISTLTLIVINQNKIPSISYDEIVANSFEGDEDFSIYVEKFYRDLEVYGIYPKKPKVTIIKFSKLDQMDNTTHIHGMSLGSGDDDKIEIYINPSSWEKFDKPMRYFLMYHELAHDVLNLDDLKERTSNEGKLMYPAISSYENKNMDDFIESSHALFEEYLEN